MAMTKLRTDRYLLECIYEMYKISYSGPTGEDGRPINDPYVAIDIRALALRMECTPELLFGRLYYHLDQKYRYKQDNGNLVPLFYLKVGEKRHAVNFPYLASILAEKNQEFRRYILALGVSFLALGVSIASLLVNTWHH